jgi:acyl transferase domain-containing protein
VGHTESTAGVANVVEVAGLLCLCETAVNVQLRMLNPQVNQVRAEALGMPADTHSMTGANSGGASSFGWSGIIAHGVLERPVALKHIRGRSRHNAGAISLYRASLSLRRPQASRLHLRPESLVSSSTEVPLAPLVHAAIAEHVVGEGVLLPGVGYVEMAMACSRGS